MKTVILALCLLGLSGCEVASACESYEECMKSGEASFKDPLIPTWEYREWCHHKAIAFKLDEISKKLDKRVLTTPEGDIVIDDGKDDGVEVYDVITRNKDNPLVIDKVEIKTRKVKQPTSSENRL